MVDSDRATVKVAPAPGSRYLPRVAATIDTERAVAHLRQADDVMAMVIEAVGPPDLREPSPTAFQALARSIIFQQLSGKAASTILGRFVALFREGATAEDAVAGFFPEPGEVLAIDDEAMRAAGVSRQKAAALRDLAAHFAEGKLSVERFGEWSDEEVIAHLLPVRGIGRWTAQMFLMFQLGRPDVLPTADVGINRAMMRLYGLDAPATPEEVERIGTPWHPWATLACWYLWRSEDVILPLGDPA